MRDTIASWQKILAQGFGSSRELLCHLELPHDGASSDAEIQFKTRVPRGFVARMQPQNPNDPLLLQVLASAKELTPHADYVPDPLEERVKNPMSGLIHKYFGRVLLVLTGACAVHCRYCFRRHFPYEDNNPGRVGWKPVMDYIASNTEIHEVILSGGDPLLASDTMLSDLLMDLQNIPHVQTIRFHTRVPVVLPERISEDFLQLMASIKPQKVMVLHVNHPHELDEGVVASLKKLSQAGFVLLNQSVLLRGVNDDATVLMTLSQRLFASGVLPYYLHLLDKVQGASHFEVLEEEAKIIFAQLQGLLPGYLVPRLAREEAGKKHKTLILGDCLS